MMWFSQEGDNPKPDDDAYIAAFYDDLDKDGDDCPTTLAASTSAAASQIRDFIEQEEQEQSPGSQTFPSVPHDDFTSALSPITRLAIVTSGSVPTPLDTDSVNYLDTLGSGNRAAACAEEFLKRGYHVVFLYREGSLRPFSRVLAKRMKKAHMLTDQVQLNSATGRLELVLDAEEEARMAQTLKTYETVKPRLLEVAFSDLFEYLYLLREACRAAAPLGHGALLFLAAGLSKMFIPRHDLSRPSAAYLDQGKESLKLSPVPHVIRAARQSWCSQAFLVAFKLENDTLSLVEGAHRLLERHGLHLVIGNTVRERNRRVLIITERDEIKLVSPHEKELEPSMVKAVVRNHKQFALEREALKSSRSLLGLSAKFTMLRENKSVVDEDAYGKKQVPFKVGLKIKADRRKADSPIYQLKAVYTNKGGSARANLWQRVIAEEEDEEVEEGGKGGKGGREGENSRGSSETSTATSTAATASPVATTTTKGKGELLLTFSPAGKRI
jgi:phosphopantothenate-cysteine ligase